MNIEDALEADNINGDLRDVIRKGYLSMKAERDCWIDNANITNKALMKETEKRDKAEAEVKALREQLNDDWKENHDNCVPLFKQKTLLALTMSYESKLKAIRKVLESEQEQEQGNGITCPSCDKDTHDPNCPRLKADTNTGHGHVWPRKDGIKARCGGPGICPECSMHKAILENKQ